MQRPRLVLVVLVVIVFAAPLFAQSNPVPFVNQPLVPSAVGPGSVGPTLTVNGAGFIPTSVVNWNGTALPTTFVNQDQLTAIVPASDVASEGTASVTVTSPAPGGGISNAVPFTVTSRLASLTFAPSTYSVGNSVVSVAAADFDNDGKADLAIVNQTGNLFQCFPDFSGSVSVLLGNGDGTFTTKWTGDLGCIGFGAKGVGVTVGDFDDDGKLDLAIKYAFPRNTFNVAIFLGNGDGTFTYTGSLALPGNGWDSVNTVVVGDFSRDGKLDLAFPFNQLIFFGILVWLGNGDGTFNFTGVDDFIGAGSLVAGDFNRDGILDLAAGPGRTLPIISLTPILLGNGDGTFTAASSQPSAAIGLASTTGDFNDDGTLDLAFGDDSTGALTVLLGNGDGTFRERRGPTDCPGFLFDQHSRFEWGR